MWRRKPDDPPTTVPTAWQNSDEDAIEVMIEILVTSAGEPTAMGSAPYLVLMATVRWSDRQRG